jgi:hypothetical protein
MRPPIAGRSTTHAVTDVFQRLWPDAHGSRRPVESSGVRATKRDEWRCTRARGGRGRGGARTQRGAVSHLHPCFLPCQTHHSRVHRRELTRRPCAVPVHTRSRTCVLVSVCVAERGLVSASTTLEQKSCVSSARNIESLIKHKHRACLDAHNGRQDRVQKVHTLLKKAKPAQVERERCRIAEDACTAAKRESRPVTEAAPRSESV